MFHIWAVPSIWAISCFSICNSKMCLFGPPYPLQWPWVVLMFCCLYCPDRKYYQKLKQHKKIKLFYTAFCPSLHFPIKIFTHCHLKYCKVYYDLVITLLFFRYKKETNWQARSRGGVEDTRLEAKDTKKIRGQDQRQGQRFRGQTLSRPRTGMLAAKAKNQGHSHKCSQKKKRYSIKAFRQSPIYRRSQNFCLGRPKPQITCNDVIKNLPVGT